MKSVWRRWGVFWLVLGMLPAVARAQFLFTTNNGTITITGYTGPGGVVVIPDTTNGWPVTSIQSGAFSSKTALTSVTIPDSITNIGNSVFQSCSGLTNVVLGNHIPVLQNQVFAFCYKLLDIKIPAGVTNIGESAFYRCTNLTSIEFDNNLIQIGYQPFALCTRLGRVTIPDSVTSIGDFAFSYCSGLTNLTVGNNVTNIGNDTFVLCTNLTAVYFHGNAPATNAIAFSGATNATVYYLPGTTGWGLTFDGRPAILWNPEIQTTAGSFGIQNDHFGFNIIGTPNIPIVVEASTRITPPAWTPLLNGTLTNGAIYFSDAQWVDYPTRIYRIRSP
jgi:hypothetical protein